MAEDETLTQPKAVEFDPFAGPQIQTTVPSTEPQREIWTAARLGPEASLAFNESVSLEMRGRLDPGALRASLGDLVRRHESLRCTFTPDGLTLCVLDDATVPFEILDLSSQDNEDRAAARAEVLAREVETPFDLEKGPLARVVVLRMAPEDHVVVFTGHHIVVDGWSWAVLIEDWAALYTARSRGVAANLPPADRFSEYAKEQAAREGGEELRGDEEYWLKEFGGELPLLDLPSDRPRPTLKTFASRREDLRLDPSLTRAVKQAGAREGASFFTTLLASFKALVFRLTGQEDLVIGIPAAGQAVSGTKALVGHCVNTLPLRSRIQPEAPFRALLQEVRGTMLDGYEHQQHTFGSLLRKLPLPRDPSRQPLVSAVFNLDQTLSPEVLQFQGLEVRLRSNPRHFETFDLFINAVEGPDGLVLECQYNTDLFDRDTVRRWIESYEILLRAVAENPGEAIAALPILGPAQRERMLVEWNRTAVDYRAEATIHELFREQVAQRPEATALLLGESRLSYAELERRSNQLAHRLIGLGVGPDILVGLCLERSFDVVAALLGILKAGGAYLPLEHNYPTERLAFMLADARARVIVTQSSLVGVLPDWEGRLLLVDRERETLARESQDAPPSMARAGNLAYVTYTSGSTGRPKGVEIPHRAVTGLVCGVDYVRLGPESTLAHCANVAFDASTFEIWGALLTGGRCALHPEAVPTGVGLSATIRGNGVTTMFLTTALFNSVVDEDPDILKGLRQLYVGGEALSVPHVRRFLEARPDTELFNVYGPTESTTFATAWRLHGPLGPEVRSLPIGRPIRDTRLYVLDPRRQPVPVGVVGELYIGGDRLARGYLNRAELTVEKFLPDPFVPGGRVYRTGDLVRYLPNGAVDFVGRSDNQVKIRGFRIELGEIEAALTTHPGVAQAAVLVREDRRGQKMLVAYVVPQGGPAAPDENLLEHLRRSLPKFMIPQHVIRLEKMPLNASGKVDRKALPAPAAGAAEETYVAPGTPTETMLAGLWEKALGLRRIGVNDDFFTLGGHSLLAAQVLSRLNREHGIVLPFRTIFEAPTIARFAAVIDERSHDEKSRAVVRIPRRAETGPAPVSLMQERILLLEELDADRRSVHNVPSVFRLEGPLDTVALEKALNDVVRRQDSLRTTFRKQDGAYRQVVAPSLRLVLETHDLSGQGPAERDERVREFVREQTSRPFDVERGPLIRAFLLRLQDAEHVFFTLRHNAVWDGWSFDIFRHELATFYEAHTGLRSAALPDLPLSYSDFAAWHREWLEGPEAKKQLAFWRERLAASPPAVELPTDRPRRAERDYVGANEWIEIPRTEADAVAELGRELGATSFMVLLGIFNVLLHRYTGQSDLVVACPVRNRPRPEIEDVIGLFTNTLMLRTQVDPSERFADLVKRVRATTIDAFSHQELPFECLGGEAPPVRVLFSLQEGRHRETALGPVKLSLPHLVSPAIAVDLNFWFVEMKHGLAGALNYSTQVFDQETMRGLVGHYRELLRAALRDPSQPVGRLTLIDPTERARLVAAAAPPPAASSEAGDLLDLLASHVARPSAAVIGGTGPASATASSSLFADASRAATWLCSRGVVAGTRVGVALGGIDRLVALLGLSWIGAVPVPLDEGDPAARLKARLSAAEAAWLWADPDTLAEVGLEPARSLPPLETGAATTSPVERTNEGSPVAWIATVFRPDGSCVATAVPSRSTLTRLVGAAHRLGFGEGSVVLTTADASPFVSLLPVVAGARVVMADPDLAADGESLRSLVERDGVNALIGPPAVWRRLIGAGWTGGPGFVVVATEPLAREIADALLRTGSPVFASWGLEEAGGWCGLERLQSSEDVRVLGAALPGIHVHVLEPSLEPAPVGVPGELFVGPDGSLGRGVGLIPTGEHARRRADGRLERLARTDGRVRVLGVRVEPAEGRLRLLEHPAVRDAAVVLRADAPGEPRLVAYVVPAPGMSFTDTELRRHLRRSVGPAAIPQHIVSVETLPRRPDGSLDLRPLPTPFATRRRESRPPQTDEEKLLVELWTEALGVPHVGIEDNFFDLGGHSLLGLQLVSRIESRTRRRLKPRLLLLSTLEQVAAELARTEATGQ